MEIHVIPETPMVKKVIVESSAHTKIVNIDIKRGKLLAFYQGLMSNSTTEMRLSASVVH